MPRRFFTFFRLVDDGDAACDACDALLLFAVDPERDFRTEWPLEEERGADEEEEEEEEDEPEDDAESNPPPLAYLFLQKK